LEKVNALDTQLVWGTKVEREGAGGRGTVLRVRKDFGFDSQARLRESGCGHTLG
jgi:hypothetical protein